MARDAYAMLLTRYAFLLPLERSLILDLILRGLVQPRLGFLVAAQIGVEERGARFQDGVAVGVIVRLLEGQALAAEKRVVAVVEDQLILVLRCGFLVRDFALRRIVSTERIAV